MMYLNFSLGNQLDINLTIYSASAWVDRMLTEFGGQVITLAQNHIHLCRYA